MEDNNPRGPIQYTWDPLTVGVQYAYVPDSVNQTEQVIRHLNMISYYEYRLRQPFVVVASTHTSTSPLENVYIFPPLNIPSTPSSSLLTTPKDDLVENRNPPAHQVSIHTSNVSPVSNKIDTQAQEKPLDLSIDKTRGKRCLSPDIIQDVTKRKRRNAKDKT